MFNYFNKHPLKALSYAILATLAHSKIMSVGTGSTFR